MDIFTVETVPTIKNRRIRLFVRLFFIVYSDYYIEKIEPAYNPSNKVSHLVDANLALSGEPFHSKKKTVSSIPPKHNWNTGKTPQKT